MKKDIQHWKDYVFGFTEINENDDEYLVAIPKKN